MATPGTDDAGGPKASQISELRRTAKWHDPPEEVGVEDDLLTGEELKLFQSVAARFNFLAMDRPDPMYSVKELMRKMASPRAKELIALKGVARYTFKYSRNLEFYGDANFAGCHSTRKSTVGGFALRSGQFVKAWSQPICIEKVVCMKTEEVLNTKTSMSPHLAPTIILKTTWQKKIGVLKQQQAAAAPKQSNRTN